MRYFFVFIICAVSVIFGAENPVLKEFPNSTQAVTEFTDSGLKNFNRNFLEFAKQPQNDLTFAKTVSKWAGVIEPLFTKGVILAFLPLTTQNEEVIRTGRSEMIQIHKRLSEAMQDPEPLSVLLAFSKEEKNQKTMTPYQRYTVHHILQNVENNPLKDEALTVQKQLASYPMQSFLYTKGSSKDKKLPKNRSLTVLNWNLCLFDGNISLLFGGVLPWQNRIDRIVEKIKKSDPDILCLQEVFSQEAGATLIQKLKSRYAHFYYAMGPNPAGFCPANLGIPAGLFVASKYPLKQERFTPYTGDQTPSFRAYGFFTADIYSKDKPLARLVVTHLQPGSDKEDLAYRSLQTKAVMASLEEKTIPTFLCGDFNIVKESKEAESLFASFESSRYQGLDWTCCELRDYWWKTKQDIAVFKTLPPQKEWLDYFFSLKTDTVSTPTFSTVVIVVNDLTCPEKSLSDHQLLFTKVIFPK